MRDGIFRMGEEVDLKNLCAVEPPTRRGTYFEKGLKSRGRGVFVRNGASAGGGPISSLYGVLP